MKRFKTVAIVGVGLIGGSIGLALRQRGMAEAVIGIGRSQPSLRTARRVGADRFIERLADGYHETVRERGSNFSVGEKQLISFARAVAFDPEILVLDEATASVDTESERLIQEGLRGLMAGRTTLVVAHRLSTIRDADRIVVLSQGRVVEVGRHDDLLVRGGEYARLYRIYESGGERRAEVG